MDAMKYYKLFTDAWRLFKKYYPLPRTDEYCQMAVDEAGEILKRHHDTLFARRFLGLVVEEVSRRLDGI